MAMPADQPGAVTLWIDPDPFRHADYAAHHTAERQLEKFLKGRGSVTVWDRVSRENHHFDAGYAATAASDFLLHGRLKPVKRQPVSLSQLAAAARK
jgi:hypothetical protein